MYYRAGGRKRFPGCARAGEGLIGATESIPPISQRDYPRPGQTSYRSADQGAASHRTSGAELPAGRFNLSGDDRNGGQKRFPGCARAGKGLTGPTEYFLPVLPINYPTPRADELSLGGPGRRLSDRGSSQLPEFHQLHRRGTLQLLPQDTQVPRADEHQDAILRRSRGALDVAKDPEVAGVPP